MTDVGPLGVDPGLLARFRRAGDGIRWQSASAPRARAGRPAASARVRRATYDDETARIEERPAPVGRCLRVESCPVGALVLLLEIDRTGRRPALRPVPAGEDPSFPTGALEAVWAVDGSPSPLPVADLVALARFALK